MSKSGYRVGFMQSIYMQLTINNPPPNALDNEKSVNPNLLKNQLNQQFKILDTN